MKPWVKWLIDHNMKFVVYFVWLVVLPAYWFVYLPQAMQDAANDIKLLKKG
jgi:hypothetical protein